MQQQPTNPKSQLTRRADFSPIVHSPRCDPPGQLSSWHLLPAAVPRQHAAPRPSLNGFMLPQLGSDTCHSTPVPLSRPHPLASQAICGIKRTNTYYSRDWGGTCSCMVRKQRTTKGAPQVIAGSASAVSKPRAWITCSTCRFQGLLLHGDYVGPN